MAKRKRKTRVKVNWLVVIAAAILLSTYLIVTISQGKDWSKWLPDWDSFVSVDAMADGSTMKIPDAAVKVHYIDVGQGDSMLIQAGKSNILIDAGENDRAAEVVSYLKGAGVQTLDLIIATHGHSDHIGGMDSVIDHFDVKKIIMTALPDALVPTTRAYTDLLRSIQKKGLKITKAKAGDQFDFGGGTLSILGPIKDYDDLNNTSVVAKFAYGDLSFLFTGDMESKAEKDLLKAKTDVSATVLKVGHHGSRSSSGQAFINAVGASCYTIEVGNENKYNHPHTETKKRLAKTGKPVYRTDLNGDIVITTDGKSYQVYTGK
ncbi:MAG: MBL fold metallo-hydrolase [Oscillospiraceae bacterium]